MAGVGARAAEFGQVALFVDDWPDHWKCFHAPPKLNIIFTASLLPSSLPGPLPHATIHGAASLLRPPTQALWVHMSQPAATHRTWYQPTYKKFRYVFFSFSFFSSHLEPGQELAATTLPPCPPLVCMSSRPRPTSISHLKMYFRFRFRLIFNGGGQRRLQDCHRPPLACTQATPSHQPPHSSRHATVSTPLPTQ